MRTSAGAAEAVRRGALLTCLAAGFTTLLDSSIVNLAVPFLARSLDASTGQVQWLLASYSLTFGLALVPAGRFGDLLGRRTLFLFGVGLFGLGSLLSGLAPATTLVIVARLVQGVGGGVISSQVLGTIQDLFDGHGRARALGAYGAAAGLAGLVGPLLGALLVTVLPMHLGWRAVVAVSAPLAAATVVVGARRLPRKLPGPGKPERRGRVDIAGLFLLATATLAMLLPLVSAELRGAWRIGSFAVAAAALVAFAWWERDAGRRDPGSVLLSPALVRAPGFVSGTLVSTFWFGAQLAQSVVLTLFLIETLRVPALLAAAVTIPSAAAMALTASVSWRLVARLGTRMISLALAAQVLLSALLALSVPHLNAGAAVPLLLGVNAVSGIAGGFVDSPNRAQALQHSPDVARGVAAGFLQLAQRLSAAVCIAAVTGIALTGHGIGTALTVCAGLVSLSLVVSGWRGRTFSRGRAVPSPVAGRNE